MLQPMGLGRASAGLLNHTMVKSKSVQMSNWETPQLTQQQVSYAALDALVGAHLYEALRRLGSFAGREAGSEAELLKTLSDGEYSRRSLSASFVFASEDDRTSCAFLAALHRNGLSQGLVSQEDIDNYQRRLALEDDDAWANLNA